MSYTVKTINVSQDLPNKNGGRANGFDLKSSIMEKIDNSIDAGNRYVSIKIDTQLGKTIIFNNESGLDIHQIETFLGIGKSGTYKSKNIGNFGFGAFMALTFLGENGNVQINSVKNNEKIKVELDFNTAKPMDYKFYDPIKVSDSDMLEIICTTKSFDIFDHVDSLANDLGAHYHDILTEKDENDNPKFIIFLEVDNHNTKQIQPIDPFYKTSPNTIPWVDSKTYDLKIGTNIFKVDCDGYFISRNTDKNELDKKGRKGFPHEYQGIYIKLNGRILKLGNGWGIEGTNNKWVGGRLEIKIDTANLHKSDKENVLKYFGITSNKNNPNLQISEKSLDKKELRDIIKSFRGWVDNQYDRFNSEKKSSKPSKTNPIENILNLKVFNIDLKTIKNGQLIERMCPDVFEALEEIQNMKNTLSES